MPRDLWWSYGGGALSHGRGTPVNLLKQVSPDGRLPEPDVGGPPQNAYKDICICIYIYIYIIHRNPKPSIPNFNLLKQVSPDGRLPEPDVGGPPQNAAALRQVMSHCLVLGVYGYRGSSLIGNSAPLGPYIRTMPMAIWLSLGVDVSYERGTPVRLRLWGGVFTLYCLN